MGERITTYVLAAVQLGPITRRGDARRLRDMLKSLGMRHDDPHAAQAAAAAMMASVIGQRCLHHVAITKRTEQRMWTVTPADIMED